MSPRWARPPAPPPEPVKPPEVPAEIPPAPPLAEVKRGRPPGLKNQTKGGDPEVSKRMVEATWQGLWVLLVILGGLFGFESDVGTLPEEEAREDAEALTPLIQRHPWIARILAFIGGPIVIVKRVMLHFRRKPAKVSPTVNAVPTASPEGSSGPTLRSAP